MRQRHVGVDRCGGGGSPQRVARSYDAASHQRESDEHTGATRPAPRNITRVDKSKVKGEQDNVHFKDGSALNRDGSWKHGGRELTRAERDWLEAGGFQAPPKP